ncbi:sialidase [Helicobacter pylori]|uniref:sialidase n=1 Tax=Helicobacter pylori TaxID=210 RepID=UPI00193419DE|nr:sialidase [Helicobacter pylori]MBM0604413.1 sialidase [Helicobacter pylori]MBM0614919.1 sialidase [Helicobacter pylori]MBM0616309.1 sialidase [Helicobacter pylori]MBM0617348.1 sialidase [Helicobacter pylori]MBM0629197.1 sialidase [Helicobacter pylori]
MEQNKKSLENLDLSDVQNVSKDISGAALEELSLKNLDKNLQILKEVGVAEICKATKIASKNIHSILEKRYESLSRVHARGFIQILEREYKIDLSAWVKEFDKVCVFKEGVGEEQKQETSPEETAKKPLKVELDYSINQANTSLSKKSSKWKPFVLVLGVVVIILLVVIIQNSSSLKEERGQESTIKPDTKNSSFNEVSPTEEKKLEPTPKLEEKPKEQDKQGKEAIKENPNTIYIIPKRDIWVEVIDLDEKKNSFQKVFKKSYPLEAKNHRLLLRFGHGHLSLKNNHQEQEYNDGKTKRFLYEPNKGLTLINETQYKELQQ